MEVSRNIRLAAVVAASLALCSCYGSETLSGDAGPDDGIDVPADTSVETVPDTHVDSAMDGDIDGAGDSAGDTTEDPLDDPLPDTHDDPSPDVGCIAQGCTVLGAGIDCCPGLDSVMDCDPVSDPECSGKEFCVDCGNGLCEGHENRDNCWEDCVEGCGGYSWYGYTCVFWEQHSCSCGWGECFPICDTVDGVMGWYERCTMRLMLMDEDCGECPMFDCLDMGTPSEGWHVACTGELIELGPCASGWRCEISHTP